MCEKISQTLMDRPDRQWAIHGSARPQGQNIAIGAIPNSSAQLFVENALAKGNLTANDGTFVILGFPNQLAALRSKKIDAGWQLEPLATATEANAWRSR